MLWSSTMPAYALNHPDITGRLGHVETVQTSTTQAEDRHVLVVDDDPNLLRMLRRGFILAGYSVLAAEDGETALRLARDHEPDVLVLDLMLPEPLNGLEVARRLRAAACNIPILMLTARGDLEDRLAGFQHGADDYLAKPFAFDELLARVGALTRRRLRAAAATSEPRLKYADLELDRSTREAWRGAERLELTAREFDLLAFFLQHPRQVLTRERVFHAVWGSDFMGASNIIDANVYCLRTKLEAGGGNRLLQTVRGVGYALRA
jgi:two-component system response regulator MprA